MNSKLTYLLGPESVGALATALVFGFCAAHSSGEGRDVERLETLVMTLPFLVVPLMFATVFVPGAKTGWWLGRFLVFTHVVLITCAGRIIAGFGKGAKGQDAAFILVIVFGTTLVALATAVAGAMVLAERRPGFAQWFKTRWVTGSFLTLLSTIPIAVVLGICVTLLVSVMAAMYTGFAR